MSKIFVTRQGIAALLTGQIKTLSEGEDVSDLDREGLLQKYPYPQGTDPRSEITPDSLEKFKAAKKKQGKVADLEDLVKPESTFPKNVVDMTNFQSEKEVGEEQPNIVNTGFTHKNKNLLNQNLRHIGKFASDEYQNMFTYDDLALVDLVKDLMLTYQNTVLMKKSGEFFYRGGSGAWDEIDQERMASGQGPTSKEASSENYKEQIQDIRLRRGALAIAINALGMHPSGGSKAIQMLKIKLDPDAEEDDGHGYVAEKEGLWREFFDTMLGEKSYQLWIKDQIPSDEELFGSDSDEQVFNEEEFKKYIYQPLHTLFETTLTSVFQPLLKEVQELNNELISTLDASPVIQQQGFGLTEEDKQTLQGLESLGNQMLSEMQDTLKELESWKKEGVDTSGLSDDPTQGTGTHT